MEIELAVASWRDGSFDAELTFILGAFLQAALRGDRAFMSEIVANVVLTVVLR